MAPRTNPLDIEACEDPVATLATHALEVIMDHPDWIGACNRIVFRSMGLHPQSMVVGDENDKHEQLLKWMSDSDYTLIDIVEMSNEDKKNLIPDFITEDDPRYQLYWELLAQLHSQVFAQMIASQKFRWTPRFAEKEKQRAAARNSMDYGSNGEEAQF